MAEQAAPIWPLSEVEQARGSNNSVRPDKDKLGLGLIGECLGADVVPA